MNLNFGRVTFTFLTASFRACIVALTATAGLLPPLISSMWVGDNQLGWRDVLLVEARPMI